MSKIQDVSLVSIDPVNPFDLFSVFFQPFRSLRSRRLRVITPIVGDTMTKQSFKRECDINFIIQQFQKTGVVSHVNNTQPYFGDVSDIPIDYIDAMNVVLDAQESFMMLSAAVRKRFNNDPAELLNFCADPANIDEMRSLGLANPLPPTAPVVDPDPK